MGVTFFGGYSTIVDVPAQQLRPLPAHFSFEEGAGFVAQFLTAWYAIFQLGGARQQPAGGGGKTALVHSAAGGVGYFAMWLLQRLGYRAVATIGSAAKRAFLVEQFGLADEQIVVRGAGAFVDQLEASSRGGGFDLVLDSLYGPYFDPAWQLLRPQGRYVLFGAGDMMTARDSPGWLQLAWKYLTRPKIDPLDMIATNKSLMGFNLIWLMDRTEEFDAVFADIADTIGRQWAVDLPKPFVGRLFSFDEAPDALRFFQSGQSVGKVVLQVTDNDHHLGHLSFN